MIRGAVVLLVGVALGYYLGSPYQTDHVDGAAS